MSELLRRSITGVVYVLLLLASIYLNSDAYDFIIMAFGLACIYEYKKLVTIKQYYVFATFLVLWWVYTHLNLNVYWIYLLLTITLLVDLSLIFYLYHKKKKHFSPLSKYLHSLFYIGGGCTFLTMIPYQEQGFNDNLIAGVFVIIWINDSFAYLSGKFLGRHKLFASVSPKKTIEGFIGGFLFAAIGAIVIAKYSQFITIPEAIILSIVVVVFGTLGDLIESKIKRCAGVKDSGAILPGHGGMLDRLDSVIFAAPFAYLTILLFEHVS